MIKYTKVRKVNSPERANGNDSWIDLFLPDEAGTISILPGENIKIPMWIKVILPEWYDLTFVNKSGIASSTWLITWACLIDNWYRGELIVNLINTSKYQADLRAWQKVIQAVIRKVEYDEIEEIDNDEYIADTIIEEWRGDWWFGSSWLEKKKPTKKKKDEYKNPVFK